MADSADSRTCYSASKFMPATAFLACAGLVFLNRTGHPRRTYRSRRPDVRVTGGHLTLHRWQRSRDQIQPRALIPQQQSNSQKSASVCIHLNRRGLSGVLADMHLLVMGSNMYPRTVLGYNLKGASASHLQIFYFFCYFIVPLHYISEGYTGLVPALHFRTASVTFKMTTFSQRLI